MTSRKTGPRVVLLLWVTAIVCFIVGVWRGRSELLAIVPSLVVIYVVLAARLRRQRSADRDVP